MKTNTAIATAQKAMEALAAANAAITNTKSMHCRSKIKGNLNDNNFDFVAKSEEPRMMAVAPHAGVLRTVRGKIERASLQDRVIKATGELTKVFNAVIYDGGKEYKVVYWGADAIKASKLLTRGTFAEFTGTQQDEQGYTWAGGYQPVARLRSPIVRFAVNGAMATF